MDPSLIQQVLIWNIWGVGNAGSQRHIRHIISANKIQLVAISEPKVQFNKASSLGRFLKLERQAGNCLQDSKIWVSWSDSLNLEVVASSSQYITLCLRENTTFSVFLPLYMLPMIHPFVSPYLVICSFLRTLSPFPG